MWKFKQKTKRVKKRIGITDETLKQFAVPCEITFPNPYFESYIMRSCKDYFQFFEDNPTNYRGRFYGRAYLYAMGGNYRHCTGKEFDTLYDAYFYAREKAFNIDKRTYNTSESEYPVEWEISMIIEIEK